MRLSRYLLILFITLLGCSSHESDPTIATSEIIKGRDQLGPRSPIYRVRVPKDWIRHDSFPEESLTDTTKPLCEFIIVDPNGSTQDPIRIVIHNFPYASIEQRIPPRAQVERWQRQFESLATHLTTIQPQAFSGYTGLLFTGVGILKDRETKDREAMVMAWALQLPAEHFRALTPLNPAASEEAKLMQMRGDVTIKATGPLLAMEQHHDAIVSFAQSFELIEEIPTR